MKARSVPDCGKPVRTLIPCGGYARPPESGRELFRLRVLPKAAFPFPCCGGRGPFSVPAQNLLWVAPAIELPNEPRASAMSFNIARSMRRSAFSSRTLSSPTFCCFPFAAAVALPSRVRGPVERSQGLLAYASR